MNTAVTLCVKTSSFMMYMSKNAQIIVIKIITVNKCKHDILCSSGFISPPWNVTNLYPTIISYLW